jgi:hypothetical protein
MTPVLELVVLRSSASPLPRPADRICQPLRGICSTNLSARRLPGGVGIWVSQETAMT